MSSARSVRGDRPSGPPPEPSARTWSVHKRPQCRPGWCRAADRRSDVTPVDLRGRWGRDALVVVLALAIIVALVVVALLDWLVL